MENLTGYALRQMIQWTLHFEGPLDYSRLSNVLCAHPGWGRTLVSLDYFESSIRAAIATSASHGAISFDCELGKWVSLEPPESSHPTISFSERPAEPWLQLGVGPQFVYCLFDPVERYRLAINGSDRWPMKIGRTSRCLDLRLNELQGGVLRRLSIGISISTFDSSTLECQIHEHMNSAHLAAAGTSTEWFWSNFLEIQDLYYQLTRVHRPTS